MADRALARKVLETEAAAILALVPRLDERFDRAVALLHECRGRVILTGMGKSGIICRKIAATLTSTGTPAFFLHPAEAIHGDLGVIQSDDVVVALSYSGETEEILRLLETIRRLGATAHRHHRLASVDARRRCRRRARLQRDRRSLSDESRADRQHDGRAGHRRCAGDDAARGEGLPEEDFANLHPGGKLGKRLMRVESADARRASSARVAPDTPMRDVIYEMSRKGLGMTCVVGRRRRAARHHHRRRLAPPDGPRAEHADAGRRRRDDARPGDRCRRPCWPPRR